VKKYIYTGPVSSLSLEGKSSVNLVPGGEPIDLDPEEKKVKKLIALGHLTEFKPVSAVETKEEPKKENKKK